MPCGIVAAGCESVPEKAFEHVMQKKAVSFQTKWTRPFSAPGAGRPEAHVEVLDAESAFDSQYQIVVETRPSETPEQADQVAETFRPATDSRGNTRG